MYSEALQAFSCMTSGRDLESPIQDESIRTVYVAYDKLKENFLNHELTFSLTLAFVLLTYGQGVLGQSARLCKGQLWAIHILTLK